jgi:hypothetical protein
MMSIGGCAGNRFTAASGGAGGSSAAGGSGSSSGGASSGGASSGGSGTADAGPISCTWTGNSTDCASGSYCDCSGPDAVKQLCTPCQTGVCVKRNTSPTNKYNPVCGCDGVTYWNLSTASNHGMAARHDLKCSDVANLSNEKTCSTAGLSCGGTDEFCDLEQQATATICTATPGTCWVLPADPKNCPDIPSGSSCATLAGATGLSCQSECAFIRQQVPWYDPQASPCPQPDP